MTDDDLRRLDRQWLLDFFSLGAWVHQYTATALYHQAQKLPTDPTVAVGDGPRIQAALRAKIVAEVAASHETLGRFGWAIEHRHDAGMAAQFVNMREDQAKGFYNGMIPAELTPDKLMERWELPRMTELANIAPAAEVNEFLEALATALPRYAAAYLGRDPTDPKAPARPLLTRAYNAIKHGSHVVANPGRLVEPLAGPEDGHVIYILTRWPNRDEELSATTVQMITRSLNQEAMTEDLEILRQQAILVSNLCQLLIAVGDARQLTYGPAASSI